MVRVAGGGWVRRNSAQTDPNMHRLGPNNRVEENSNLERPRLIYGVRNTRKRTGRKVLTGRKEISQGRWSFPFFSAVAAPRNSTRQQRTSWRCCCLIVRTGGEVAGQRFVGVAARRTGDEGWPDWICREEEGAAAVVGSEVRKLPAWVFSDCCDEEKEAKKGCSPVDQNCSPEVGRRPPEKGKRRLGLLRV